MNKTVLECKRITRFFITEAETIHVLKGIDLELKSGVTAAITGSSGSGKSTLLSILGVLDRASGGSLFINGLNLTDKKEDELASIRSSMTGFVFQFHYLLKDFTALENAMLPAYMAGMPKKDAIEKAAPILEAVGLAGRFNHTPARLSGGERQRVAIARALINDPLLILADEPSGNLDEYNARLVMELLFDLAESSSRSLLVATHDPEIAAMAQRRFHLSDGVLNEV